MNTYIAILRGINVSGKKLIKMDSLREMLSGLGFEDVTTYIQSGNVVFRSNPSTSRELEALISKAINGKFSFEVPVIVLDCNELNSIVEQNPLLKEYPGEMDKLHITILADEPDTKPLGLLNQTDYTPEKFIIKNKAVYLYCPNGYGNTKLNNNFFEKKLKVTATTRNLKTLTELINICKNY